MTNRQIGLGVLSCLWLGVLACMLLEQRWDVAIAMVVSNGLGGALTCNSIGEP